MGENQDVIDNINKKYYNEENKGKVIIKVMKK